MIHYLILFHFIQWCLPCFALPLGAGEISLSRSITHRPFTRATETRGLFGDVQDVQWTPALEA